MRKADGFGGGGGGEGGGFGGADEGACEDVLTAGFGGGAGGDGLGGGGGDSGGEGGRSGGADGRSIIGLFSMSIARLGPAVVDDLAAGFGGGGTAAGFGGGRAAAGFGIGGTAAGFGGSTGAGVGCSAILSSPMPSSLSTQPSSLADEEASLSLKSRSFVVDTDFCCASRCCCSLYRRMPSLRMFAFSATTSRRSDSNKLLGPFPPATRLEGICWLSARITANGEDVSCDSVCTDGAVLTTGLGNALDARWA